MSTQTLHFGGSFRRSPPLIIATAAVNGLGYDSPQTWAFWRADGSALTATPFWLHTGERATMAIVRSLEPRLYGVDRMATLLEAAIMHLHAPLSELRVTGRAGMFVSVNEHFAEHQDPYFGRWDRRLQQSGGRWLERHGWPPMIRTFPRGHAGFAHALIAAIAELEEGSLDFAIVGGVDSYYDPLRFDILEEQERIFDQSRADAFIPGEGAAVCLLVSASFARRAGAAALAAIESVAVAEEPAPMLSTLPCNADGLTRAMREVTARLKSERRLVEWMLDDLTNESYRADELTLAIPRAFAPGGLDTAGQDYGQIAADAFRGDHLPESFGDLGAATMPTAVAIATEAFMRGDPDAENCMIVSSSTGADRGVMLLRAAAGQG